jgi:A/G-specific adenine glycosylase
MLQQTTVTAVVPYYEKFLKTFPTFNALSKAPLEDILFLWQGLGYYSRARNLHACAQVVVQKYHGLLPQTEAALLALPGVGPYTAAAIVAIAFNQPATVVDGNVERVISRLYRIKAPLPKAKKEIRLKAKELTDLKHPGTYAEAIMDLGATICTPKSPGCTRCPVQAFCTAFTRGEPEAFPIKPPRKQRPVKKGTAWIVIDKHGCIYLRQRSTHGLLGGLWEVPHTDWEMASLPFHKPENTQPCGEIKHVFTHFELRLDIKKASTNACHPPEQAFKPDNLPPLSTLMRKVLRTADF